MASKSVVAAFVLLLALSAQTSQSFATSSFDAFSAMVIDNRNIKNKNFKPVNSLPSLTAGLSSDVKPYDTLVLATEWVGSVCSARKCNNGRPVNDKFFNIHGLWPNNKMNSADSPMDCASSNFNLASLPADIKQMTDSAWNALYNLAQSFLSHEWSKHGTCWNPQPEQSSQVPADLVSYVDGGVNALKAAPKDMQVAYIRMTLALATKYNAFAGLAAKNILPSDSAKYQRTDVVNALTAFFGVKNFGLMCTKTAAGESLLSEVRLCLDRNYRPTDCKSMNLGCPAVISYPMWR